MVTGSRPVVIPGKRSNRSRLWLAWTHRMVALPRSSRFRQLQRWDPLAFIFLAHGVGLSLAGETGNPVAVSLLSGGLAVGRLALAWLLPRGTEPTARFVIALLSAALTYTVVLVDGGTESPFFFWVLLLLGWQALVLDQKIFRRIGVVNVAAYLLVVAIVSDLTAAAIFRFGLLVAFILTLALGREVLDRREEEVARLDDVVRGIIDDAPMAMAVLDADRDTLLYANTAAHGMGIDSRDAMAHLLLDDPARPQRITTLADLVVGSGFHQSPLRTYRHIGSARPQYRIGFHPRRVGQARPVVLVYGLDIDAHDGG